MSNTTYAIDFKLPYKVADFMLKVAVKDMEAYYDFHVNKLSEAENIGHVQSVFVMGIVKQTHTLLS